MPAFTAARHCSGIVADFIAAAAAAAAAAARGGRNLFFLAGNINEGKHLAVEVYCWRGSRSSDE